MVLHTCACDMFHFLPSNQHFKSHHVHLVGRHKLLGMMKVTCTRLHNTLCTNACMEPKDTTSFIYRSRVPYIKLYKLAHTLYTVHVMVIYIPFNCCLCDTTGVYTNGVHIIDMKGNGTTAYSMYNAVCTVNKYIVYICSCNIYIRNYLTVGLCVHGLI